MAKKVIIAELAIDNKKLISELQQTKKGIDDLTATQKDLKKAGETSSKTFVENEVKLKSLRGEYNAQVKVLQTTSGAQDKLTNALDKNIKSVDEAKANNAELVKIRNQMNASTTEGAKAIDVINKRLDDNNAKINAGSSALEKQFQNIGNYPEELDKVSGGLGGVAKGFLSSAKAGLAFIATPIGAVIALVAGALVLVKTALDRSEESTNKIRKAFSAFSGIGNKLFKTLEPLADFLIDGLVKGFELVEVGIYNALDAIATGLEFLNFDEQAASLRNFNKEVKQASADAKVLEQAEQDLVKAQRGAEKLQLDRQKAAEKLRQVRDDESKSIKERADANEQLGEVLKQQGADELAIANQAIRVAQLRIKAEGDTTEALDAKAEAELKVAEIQERIVSQESEQLVNLTSLRKEAADKAIQLQNDQLTKFIASQGFRAKTLEEQLKIDEQIADKRIKILEKELRNRNITQAAFDAELLNIQNELGLAKANIAVENAQLELDAYVQNNLSKLDNDKFFSDEALKIEQERLDGIATKQREFAATQLAEGVINQTEYNAAINEIDESFRIQKEENDLARKEAQLEADAIDLENRLAIEEEQFANAFELESARIEQQRLRDVEAAEKSGADVTLINQKYAQQQAFIEEQLAQQKLSVVSDTLGQVAALLGKNTAAGKAAGIAQATINTYQGITEVWKSPSTLPEPFATGARIVSTGTVLASGLSAVKKIASTKTPKAERGMLLSGNRHSQGGIHIEAEDGEAVMNRRTTAMFLPQLSAMNQAGGGVPFMANGGVVGSVSQPSSSIIDYDLLAEASANLPAPIVSVEEISTVSNRVQTIESTSVF